MSLTAIVLIVMVFVTACGQRQITAVPSSTSVPASSVVAVPTSDRAAAPTGSSSSAKAATTPRAVSGTAQASVSAAASPQTTPGKTIEKSAPTADLVHLKIPSLQVDAAIEKVGNAADGTMDIPKKVEDVAWYDLGPQPGELGNAVMAGHLDSEVAPAVFWRLHDLKPGDHVLVTRTDQSQLDFVVTRTQTYPFDKAPLNEIFGNAPTANLNLITCGGTFDRQSKNYSDRLVVFTTLSA